MSARSNETIWPGLIFLGTWWAFAQYPVFEPYALPGALALWFVGLIAVRMFSSTVHHRGFWGWVLLLEIAGWYCLAFFAPLEPLTTLLLLWGVATPLLFVGNIWRRTYDRFPPLRGFLRVTCNLAIAASLTALPVVAFWVGSSFWPQLAEASAFTAAGWLCLWYGWRLAALPPSGEYDARFGSVDDFRRRGFSHER
jgi:hypothetical protein